MSYATVTLTGTYQMVDGSPASGTIEIIPSEKVILDADGNVILTGRKKVKLDELGAFSVDLPATDDPNLNPTGFGYTVAARLHHQHIAAVSFQLPAAVPTVDMADVTPVDPSTFTPSPTYSAYIVAVENGFEGTEEEWLATLVGPQGPEGPTGPQGIRGDEGPQGVAGPQGESGVVAATTPIEYDAETQTLSAPTLTDLPGTYAPIGITPDGGAQAVGKGELTLNVKDYGATGDGTTDDAAAIQAAFDALAAVTGGAVYFPPGTYRLASPLTVSTNYPRIYGTPASILQSDVTSGVVLTIARSGALSGMRLQDLYIIGSGSEDALVRADYCLDAIVTGCRIEGSGGTGLELRRPQNLTLLANEVRGSAGWGVDIALLSGNGGQLCKVIGNTVFGNDAGATGAGGIRIANSGEHVVVYNQIEKHDAHADSIGILDAGVRNHLDGNTFELNNINVQWGNTTATSARCHFVNNKVVGGRMVLENYQGHQIRNNVFEDRHSGEQWSVEFLASPTGAGAATVWADNYEVPLGPQDGRVTNNATTGVIVYESSLDNRTAGAMRTFDNGDTTPNVAGSSTWKTGNTAATTITALDGGYRGKQMTILFMDNNTTIADYTNGGSVRLTGTANWTPGTRDTLTVLCDNGSVWYELGRSNN